MFAIIFISLLVALARGAVEPMRIIQVKCSMGLTAYSGSLFVTDYRRTSNESFEDVIHQYDSNTGSLIRVFEGGHTARIYSIFAADGFLFSRDVEGKIGQWSLENGKPVRFYNVEPESKFDREVHEMVVSKGYLFTHNTRGSVGQWNIQNGEFVRDFKSSNSSYSPQGVFVEGDLLYVGQRARYRGNPTGGEVDVFEINTGKRIATSFTSSSTMNGGALLYVSKGRIIDLGASGMKKDYQDEACSRWPDYAEIRC